MCQPWHVEGLSKQMAPGARTECGLDAPVGVRRWLLTANMRIMVTHGAQGEGVGVMKDAQSVGEISRKPHGR